MRIPRAAAALAAVLVAAGTGAALIRQSRSLQQAIALYYCPMHPTYTSDRPGDCPICNMKLVKRDMAAPAPAGDARFAPGDPHAQASDQFQSICYLHNCAKLHEGKPCPMTVLAKPGEKVTCPICGTHIAEAAGIPGPAEKQVLYWTDPMIPGFRADAPGTSPMGMDLVPVYEEEHGAPAAPAPAPEGYAPVLLTPQKQQLIGVRTAPVTRRPLTKTVRTVGRIAYDPDLYQAQAEYLQAQASLARAQAGAQAEAVAEAQRLVDASETKLRLMGLSQELINETAAQAGPDRSLLSGAEGRAWVYAPIYEFELPLIQLGQTIRVDVPGSDQAFEGVIRAIDPILDPATRSVRVRAVLDDARGALRPEMFVNVSIQLSGAEALTIPEEAVFQTGTKQIVFVELGQGLFEPREIAVGIQADGLYEVKQGLAEGERVVSSGNFLIDSESRLKAAAQGADQAGHQHGR
jgi:hypothetical protein